MQILHLLRCIALRQIVTKKQIKIITKFLIYTVYVSIYSIAKIYIYLSQSVEF